MCHTCSGFGKFLFKRFDVQFIVIANTDELVMDGGGGAGDFIKIKFCPMCGRSLTPLALDGGDSAASEQLSTPEVLSTLQGESTLAHRK